MLVQYTGMDTHFCGPSMPYCRCIISFECKAKVDKVSRHSVPPSTVCVDWLADDDLPQFRKIDDLIYVQSFAIMVATQYHTVGIDRHYHSYIIAITRCESVIPLTNVKSHPPVNVRVLPSGMHFTLCYHVLNVGHTSV